MRLVAMLHAGSVGAGPYGYVVWCDQNTALLQILISIQTNI